ncbi:hypothetical protein [Vagococcus acidifermentans]|uniref:Uncharacterized protein n=1 Tax=Vagococcus acidifermentans TaxID=564710 RepID=A0A430B089_9ENTE|nr:hypothetical protein [Vagococcus acidifermentans]RSU13763.1 hypothetical protein CBF27_02355 [Vagococcus acidifermentans]
MTENYQDLEARCSDKYRSDRYRSRQFISNRCTLNDLQELKQLIAAREIELKRIVPLSRAQ